jgi:predicted RNA-binding protein Jag
MNRQKRSKAVAKSNLTKFRNKMLKLLDEDLPSRREVRSYQSRLEELFDNVMVELNTMMDIYDENNDEVMFGRLIDEMEQFVEEHREVQKRAQEYLDSRLDEVSSLLSRVEQWQQRNRDEISRQIKANEHHLQKMIGKLGRTLGSCQVDADCLLGSQVDVDGQDGEVDRQLGSQVNVDRPDGDAYRQLGSQVNVNGQHRSADQQLGSHHQVDVNRQHRSVDRQLGSHHQLGVNGQAGCVTVDNYGASKMDVYSQYGSTISGHHHSYKEAVGGQNKDVQLKDKATIDEVSPSVGRDLWKQLQGVI